MKRRIYTFVMLGTALLFMAINGSSCQDDYLKDGGTTSLIMMEQSCSI